MPRPAQHPHRGVAELLPYLGHHLLGEVQQHELDSAGSKPICSAAASANARSCTRELGPRVRRADHDDRPPGRGLGRVVVDVGQLELFEHVVAQIERLGGRLQPARVRRRDRARRTAG